VGDKAEVTLGNGQTLTLEQKKEGKELETCVLELTPKAEDYDLTIEADKLVTLRITASKCVNGVKSLQSKSLVCLNLDETKLTETPELDFSNCPNIEEITLGGAGVTDVILPNNPKLKTFIASPAYFGDKALRCLDLRGCTQLETLVLKGVALPIIDVRACRKTLKHLTIEGANEREFPERLLGGKRLKKLSSVNISYCSIGMDELPDLNKTPLDNFKIGGMYWHYVGAGRASGLSVNFKNIKRVKGISAIPVETKFTWYQKVNDNWEELPLDNTKVTEKDGVFTFAPSILRNGTALVRCKIESAAYPDLAGDEEMGLFTYNMVLSNLIIELEHPQLLAELTVTEESIGKDENNEELTDFNMMMQIKGTLNSNIGIDWDNGSLEELTITSTETQRVSSTVALGSVVRIYVYGSGAITLLDASNSHLVEANLGVRAQNLKTLRLAQNRIESINLEKVSNSREVLLNNNLLSSIGLRGTEVHNLHALDLSKNKLDACAINDCLMLLPTALTEENPGPNNVVKLAGNPGSTTYDKALLPVANGDGGLTWKSDVEGDGTGCATAKVFDLSNRENGSAKLLVSGTEVAFETPIAKNSPLVAVLTPKQGYKVASLRFNGKEESASSSNANEFSLKLEHNSRLFYTFAEDTALDDVFASAISVARVAEGYQLGNLPTGATYSLYSVEGALLAQGTITNGTLILSLDRGNYLLSINGSTLKLAF